MVDDRTALMSARALNQGYEILWYRIERVLGQGGFGITYLAHDRNLDRSVAIKEYLPTSFAYRREDDSVKPITGDHRESFVWGLNSFQKEAQTLARFSHPNIVRVNSVFEANNTAYMVMEYEHGQSLTALYKNKDKSWDQAFFEQIFFPIFDGLKEVHKFDFIHRDIKPANIYIRDDQTPVLLDFGSARQTSKQQNSEMTSLVSQGYTPLEQYNISYGEQGPWTDIYALAATIYEGIAGSKPDESLSRSARLLRAKPDLVAKLLAHEYPGFSQPFLDAVYAGLKLEPEGRPQSIEVWSHLFKTSSGEGVVHSKSSGLTSLGAERMRAQPPRNYDQIDRNGQADPDYQNSIDEFELHQSGDMPGKRVKRNSSSAAPGLGARSHRDQVQDQSDHQTFDDLLDFDDDDVFGGNSNAMRSPTNKSKRSRPATSNSFGPMMGIALVLALMSAGAGYMFYTSKMAATDTSTVTLNTMPSPSKAMITTLPKDKALEQLSYMENLAPLLTQAYSINSTDPELLDTIRQTDKSLLSLAQTWNAGRYGNIASQIKAVSNAMPAAEHDADRVQAILAASDQVMAYDQIIAYLDDKHYLRPSGKSVLDKISTVNIGEYQQLKSTPQWQRMMAELFQQAMDKLANSEFDDVIKLTEAALSLDADHTGFNALKTHLARS